MTGVQASSQPIRCPLSTVTTFHARGQGGPEGLLGLTRAAGAVRAESLSTLKFAQRAKAVRNVARVNEDLDQRTLLRRYEGELRRLRAELQQRQRDVVDKRQLLQACLCTVCTLCCSHSSLHGDVHETHLRRWPSSESSW